MLVDLFREVKEVLILSEEDLGLFAHTEGVECDEVLLNLAIIGAPTFQLLSLVAVVIHELLESEVAKMGSVGVDFEGVHPLFFSVPIHG
jgi:hypothetical protein